MSTATLKFLTRDLDSHIRNLRKSQFPVVSGGLFNLTPPKNFSQIKIIKLNYFSSPILSKGTLTRQNVVKNQITPVNWQDIITTRNFELQRIHKEWK